MKKSRECMYCLFFFECTIERDSREGCLHYKPYSEESEKRHVEWLEDMRKELYGNDSRV